MGMFSLLAVSNEESIRISKMRQEGASYKVKVKESFIV